MVEVTITNAFVSWQQRARELLRRGVPPDEVRWVEAPRVGGIDVDRSDAGADNQMFVVPRRFVELAKAAAAHVNADRWSTMYRVLWRLVHENRRLLEVQDDPDVRALAALQLSPAASPAFEAPPEAGPSRIAVQNSLGFDVTTATDLGALASAAVTCTACELYKNATQVVFGRGPESAHLVLVGEQPGDQEDLQGAPFVGPAGEVLDRALHEIGLDRRSVYITNIVKHFKWEPRGKRRIHQTPRANEIQACRPWLEAELAFVKPRVIVCLGSTAAQALIGPQFRITSSRGQFYRSQWAPWVMGTYHPSAVLRAEDPAGAEGVYRFLVEDLRQAVRRAHESGGEDRT
jgi:uracil-DNA glycosylase family protein